MNQISALRAAFPTFTPPSMPRVDPAGTAASRIIRPGELQEASPTVGPAVTTETRPPESSFSNLLSRMVSEVNAKQNIAAQTVAGLQSGQPVTLHQAMISMEEASVSFQLMAEVRNKLLESYQELMRMQV